MLLKKWMMVLTAITSFPAVGQDNAEVSTEQEISGEQPAESQHEVVEILSAKLKPNAAKNAWDILVVAKEILEEPTIEVAGKSYDFTLVSQDGDVVYKSNSSFHLYRNNTMLLKAKNLEEEGYKIGVVVTSTSEGNVIELTPGKEASASKANTQNATKQASAGQFTELLALINNYRAQNGRGSLTYDPSLNFADNRRHSVFDKKGIPGVTNWAGAHDAGTVFQMWRNSAGHNANMLNRSIKRAGFGSNSGGTTFTGGF